jgi:hypothetical protein
MQCNNTKVVEKEHTACLLRLSLGSSEMATFLGALARIRRGAGEHHDVIDLYTYHGLIGDWIAFSNVS